MPSTRRPRRTVLGRIPRTDSPPGRACSRRPRTRSLSPCPQRSPARQEFAQRIRAGGYGGGQAILPVRTGEIACPPLALGMFRSSIPWIGRVFRTFLSPLNSERCLFFVLRSLLFAIRGTKNEQ